MSAPSQPEVAQPEILTNLNNLQQGARFLLWGSLAVLVLLLVMLVDGSQDWRPLLSGVLHAVNFAATMTVAVGALHGHMAMIKEERRTQDLERQTQELLAERLARLERIEECLLRAAGDEVSIYRNGGGHR